MYICICISIEIPTNKRKYEVVSSTHEHTYTKKSQIFMPQKIRKVEKNEHVSSEIISESTRITSLHVRRVGGSTAIASATVYMYTYMYIHMYIYICIYIDIVYIYIYIYKYVYIYTVSLSGWYSFALSRKYRGIPFDPSSIQFCW
jgi:hypothetical protein